MTTTNNSNLHTCSYCARPFPTNLMASMSDGNFICPQCAAEIEVIYKKYQGDFDSGRLDSNIIFSNSDTEKSFNGVYVREVVAAYNRAVAANPNLALRQDEYLNIASGMAFRLENGDFEGDPQKCFNYIWEFQAMNKFKRYLPLIAQIEEEVTYEMLCRVLVLNRPKLGEIMELVNYMMKYTKR